ncbi:hypothetical protein JNJ66_00360 [Candidatus Saccharibacteria bacterium]|nr:hypothetical protein [Candidatus Saccharibacteria bacterium]
MITSLFSVAARAAALIAVAAVAQLLVPAGTAAAATPAAPSQPPATQNQNQGHIQNPASQATYRYTAQAGDSYHTLARKAAQTYGLTQKIEVGKAGIIFVETNLAQAAGSPAVSEGQTVEFSLASLKQWMDAAKNLSAEDKAAWESYVGLVDFNTSQVGRA